MSRTLLQEIAHQIFYTPKKRNHHNRKPNNQDYERQLYKLKQSAFENKKAYEIAKHIAKSKGWL